MLRVDNKAFLRTSHHIYDANLTTSGMLLIGKSKIKMVIKLNVHQKLNFFNFDVGIPEIITLVRKYWKLIKKIRFEVKKTNNN